MKNDDKPSVSGAVSGAINNFRSNQIYDNSSRAVSLAAAV